MPLVTEKNQGSDDTLSFLKDDQSSLSLPPVDSAIPDASPIYDLRAAAVLPVAAVADDAQIKSRSSETCSFLREDDEDSIAESDKTSSSLFPEEKEECLFSLGAGPDIDVETSVRDIVAGLGDQQVGDAVSSVAVEVANHNATVDDDLAAFQQDFAAALEQSMVAGEGKDNEVESEEEFGEGLPNGSIDADFAIATGVMSEQNTVAVAAAENARLTKEQAALQAEINELQSRKKLLQQTVTSLNLESQARREAAALTQANLARANKVAVAASRAQQTETDPEAENAQSTAAREDAARYKADSDELARLRAANLIFPGVVRNENVPLAEQVRQLNALRAQAREISNEESRQFRAIYLAISADLEEQSILEGSINILKKTLEVYAQHLDMVPLVANANSDIPADAASTDSVLEDKRALVANLYQRLTLTQKEGEKEIAYAQRRLRAYNDKIEIVKFTPAADVNQDQERLTKRQNLAWDIVLDITAIIFVIPAVVKALARQFFQDGTLLFPKTHGAVVVDRSKEVFANLGEQGKAEFLRPAAR